MKHTKKVVSIPEAEYAALINIASGGDPIKQEKLETGQRISKLFKNNRLSELEKGVKYQALQRKKRKLTKMVENQPQKVILEKGQEVKPLPTTGIEPTTTESLIKEVQQLVKELQQRYKLIKNKPEMQQKTKDTDTTTTPVQPLNEQPHPSTSQTIPKDNEPEKEEETREKDANKRTYNTRAKTTLDQFKGVKPKESYNELLEYVNNHRKNFHITREGLIEMQIKGSWEPEEKTDFQIALKYLTGVINDISGQQKKAVISLINRFNTDNHIRQMMVDKIRQQGTGNKKRYIVELRMKKSINNKKGNIQNNKTEGLTRRKIKFKPQLWTKIPA